ncbi:AbrB/MazE/SpoVT family DNA-binding domain-containing protein [Acanthopleuribacter pedis]|uniref:AbrB/MazE/SpoVT family DNA-binding domain-containing protein n=1 Tax=Acanthopleuribacter pedis TaxID=442870 RepID=A0A8J7QAP8_9BACT|nr:AbrB/MazE/SpoVT family DNA-binding domain-containing protein [Acanthopleuribacter pedis]
MFVRIVNRSHQVTLPSEFYKDMGIKPKDLVFIEYVKSEGHFIIKPFNGKSFLEQIKGGDS